MGTEFLGIRVDNPIPFADVFDTVYNDDGQLYLISKKIFRYEDDDMKFDYRYGIVVLSPRNYANLSDCDYIIIALYFAPEPKDWCDNALKEAAKLNGWEDMPRDELIESLNLQDAEANGYCAKFGSEEIFYDSEEFDEGFYDTLDNETVVEKLNTASACIDLIDAMGGYKLDSTINGLGITNWDILREVVNGKSAIKTALGRLDHATN